MRDILGTLERWVADGIPAAVGTIVERVGSAPRDPGASLGLSARDQIAGSVTGGCVETAVLREAREVLAGGPGRLCRYGLDDTGGFEIGLGCGGKIAIAVYLLDPALVVPAAHAVAADEPLALTLRLDEDTFGEQRLVQGGDAGEDIRSLLAAGESGIVKTASGELVFVESIPPRPDLYIFGSSAHCAALVTVAGFLGYRVTVCDARGSLVTPERFPDADALVVDWPDRFLDRAPIDERTAICVLTHDRKFDVPAILRALDTPAGYVGAIGSEQTTAERNALLRSEGLGEAELARVHAPIGLAIGARSPQEVAVAIGAQLIEVANARRRAARDTRGRPVTTLA
jgi:xanthine dehydrogenase accessory factor